MKNIVKALREVSFSKLILTYTIFLATLTVFFAMALMWKTGTTDGLAYLIPSVFAELGSATGFYFYKAKAENELKIKAMCNSMRVDEDTGNLEIMSNIEHEDLRGDEE